MRFGFSDYFQQAVKALLLGLSKESELNGLETELLVFGRITLAHSARCFTARSEDRPKDDCQYCCINYPQGRKMNSREGEKVFVLNGIQTMSGYQYNLINELPDMAEIGVDIARVSADGQDAFWQLDKFKAQLTSPTHHKLDNVNECNGYWHKIAGMSVA